MRVTNKDLEKITELANRTLGSAGPVTESDLRIAILHVRWLATMDKDRAESWGRFYGRRFSRIGVKFPAVGKDLRSVTSPKNVKLAQSSPNVGRPSGRPSYCERPLQCECARCPLRWGRFWDCTGRPVSGSWGVSVVVDGVEVRAARRKDGKPLRGSFYAGGYAFSSGVAGWFKVPKGWSAETYIDQLWPVPVKSEVSSTFSKVVGEAVGVKPPKNSH